MPTRGHRPINRQAKQNGMSTLRLLWIANDAARLRQSWMDTAPRPVYYEFTTNLAEGLQRLNRGAADVVLLTLPVEHWTASGC